ncbi:MAG: hypothetical protein ACOCZ9_02140 [Spirochaetota bacterium]
MNSYMRRFHVVLLLFCIAFPLTAIDNDTYLEVANDVLSGEPDLRDFTELREAFTQTSWYNPAPDRTWLQELDAAIDAGEYEQADEFINSNYFYFLPVMDFHLAAMATYREIDDEETREWHDWFFQRLIDSVFESGDGESTETAYTTIYEREQMIALEVLGLELQERRQEERGDRLFYVYETRDPEGNDRDVYFDFTAAKRWREQQQQGQNDDER